MDFQFNEEQRMAIEGARRFSQEKLAPAAAEFDEKAEVNLKGLKELGRLGYLGMTVPEDYGGSAMGAVAYAGSMVEVSKADAGVAVGMSVQNSLVNDAILHFGTEAQKTEFLPKLSSGEWIGCFSLTEAGAGSDPASMRTTAARDGQSFVLNGTKNFTTNGGIADVIIVFTRGGPDGRNNSTFLVKKETPGFSVGKHEHKMGIRSSSTTELVFQDCRVPASALLGEEGKGLKIALTTLDGGRIGIAAQAVGIAEAALDESVRYAKERIQFGKPIAELEGVQFMLADMATEVELAKTMLFRVAWMKESGHKRFTKEAAMLKLFASEMSHRVCHKAVQVHGGYGYMKEYKVERLYRDQRITEIYEGTSEIQRYVIARTLLGA
ncbi:MAG: acyl-CoA dehydrogenase [Elusimicrobia bacterium GWA2_69_24]|nr:MAG: acyl-CoA dehydrogenase [Elusimicrobia bacterium GWA2_69_24]HBL18681.1 acyl-CoA dehydrogenase [Elusimicrobiota bacterium]